MVIHTSLNNILAYFSIKIPLDGKPQDLFNKLLRYFAKIVGNKGATTFEQSYDESEQLFRFDFPPSGMSAS